MMIFNERSDPMNDYVHGYSQDETNRLQDQSQTLAELLHHNTRYPAGSRVLEAGCGVGGQTIHLVKNSPGAIFTSLDYSFDSLREARQYVNEENNSHAGFIHANLLDPPFAKETFDHIFLCFVLEHLTDPVRALLGLKTLLKPGGTVTVIEGDHGSAFFHPETDEAWRVWNCLIDAQAKLGADSLIGRRLYPLLTEAQFQDIRVTPRPVYADASRPQWVDGFTIKTIVAMVKGVKQRSIDMGLIDEIAWENGIRALCRCAENPDGVFCYSFFKATGIK